MLNQRLLIGAAAIVCLSMGLYLWLSGNGESIRGILIKVGLMLAAVCLAFPTIKTLDNRTALMLFAVLFVLLVLAAARPRIFLVGCVLAAIALAANWALKSITLKKP